jgi:FkbM family methyltransferase
LQDKVENKDTLMNINFKISFIFLLYCASVISTSNDWYKEPKTYALLKKNGNAEDSRKFYGQFISANSLVFDIGANMGRYTREYLASGGRVICVEPQPVCADHIRKSLGGNSNVTVVQKGVGDKPGKLPLYICSYENMLSTFSKEAQKEGRFAERGFKWDKKVLVELVTLDRLIAEFGAPQFCKIDVEGFEYEVVCGLSQPIKYLSIEYHIENMNKVVRCLDHLESIGFNKFNFTIGEYLKLVSPDWLSKDELVALIKRVSSELDWAEMWGLWGDVYAHCDLI